MSKLKNFFKKILPPPVNTFRIEIERVIAAENENKRLIVQQNKLLQQRNQLLEEAYMGLNTHPRSPKIIVSLTSFPARIEYVHQTIRSILLQTLKPDMVILWLAREQFPKGESSLPFSLRALCKYGLTIRWCEDLRSYKKLIPTLREYPDDIIVTTDDNGIYERDWLEILYTAYLDSLNERKPRICCHRITKFDKDSDGNWFTIGGSKSVYKRPSYLHKLVGVGGVLYPPHSLHPDVLDVKLFQKLAPTNDDIWFWLMAVRNGTRIKLCSPHYAHPVTIPGSQVESLPSINDNEPKLFWQDFNRMIEHYPEIMETLDWEWELLHTVRRSPEYYASVSPDQYPREIEYYYNHVMHQDIDIYHPVNHNEKIQWLKIFDATQEKTRLADKYLVRDWIAEKIGPEYLVPLIGVYDNADEIYFDALPKSFVLKANHGSGWNLLVHDKTAINWNDVKAQANEWISKNYAYIALEMHYRDIPPKLIIEEMLVDEKTGIEARDYKIFCFNGTPTYIWVDSGRFSDHYRDIFDCNWNLMPFNVAKNNSPETPTKPNKLDEMIKIAETLSAGFSLVRIDFYYVNDSIYFGEMTFTPGNGRSNFIPEETSYLFGDQFTLPANN